jgi:CheY-like chemotaxis protein
MNYADKAFLYNRRILVVEDEAFIAMLVRDALTDVGCRPIIAQSWDAPLLARRELIDCALLDVKSEDDTVFAVADTLARRDIPFVFASGCHRGILPEKYLSRVLLPKPYLPTDIARTILISMKMHPAVGLGCIRKEADNGDRGAGPRRVRHTNSD